MSSKKDFDGEYESSGVTTGSDIDRANEEGLAMSLGEEGASDAGLNGVCGVDIASEEELKVEIDGHP